MKIENNKEALILFVGDSLILVASLWVALFLRNFAIPDIETYYIHLAPFSFLFAVWFLIFFISGLYEKHTLLLKGRLPSRILNAQLINSVIAVFFFYFVPIFSITPKINLFLDLVVTFLLMVFWRLFLFPRLGFSKRQNALLVGSGEEMKELYEEINNNSRYRLKFISYVDLDKLDGIDFKDEVLDLVYGEEVSTIVIDLRNQKIASVLPHFYNLIFSKVHFVDTYRVYEDIFNRVPLALVNYNWFLENISSSSKITYDFLKRAMDIIVSGILWLCSLAVYPFIILAIKMQDGGPVFIVQERVGKGNLPIYIRKFRTMNGVDLGSDVLKSKLKVTRVGSFLRKTRLDEIPQLWNVLRGDISLIGPRPEIPLLVQQYAEAIPYYNIRHLIKPGLSGWAQIYHENHPHHGTDISATRDKLSYDLYYVKNRSFILDIKIALKTIKTVFSRSGA
jgi:exopolysaccharide biosynthesis polyprenyl glycosylphosphotransferase